jgi:serine/threonine protein kinase
MSLENLLVHESGALIIDMGMCLRLPVEHDAAFATQTTQHLSASFGNMNIMNGGSGRSGSATETGAIPSAAAAPATISSPYETVVSDSSSNNNISATVSPPPPPPSVRSLRRFMVTPQGTCGKWIYMSPEVYKNAAPFDGFAVDMWAAGVILFLMLTGFPPWDRACQTDERFKYMSAGYLVQMLTEWEIGISPDAMDLLQRMLFFDPKDRLSLDQVRAHPWMVNGPSQPPPNNTVAS